MYSTKEQEEKLSFISYSDLLSEDNLSPFDEVSSVVFFICDLSNSRILFVSNSSKELLGHNPEELMQGGLDAFISLIHPDDYPMLLSRYAAKVSDMKKSLPPSDKTLCLTSYLRISHGDGHWVKLHADLIMLSFDTDNNPEKIFGNLKVHAERKSPAPMFPDFSDKPSRKQVALPIQLNLKEPPCEKVSCREMQVLRLIADGYSAKQIADKLYISEHTAINHRKNLIEKFNVKNTAELIKDASKVYWL
ncbi:LuxR family transcriptional regulator protein [Fulvivirga imtechensis AK7]|uniref:LuxR family transcriptional regulator protein n=1 Tax=Fulvivirga imtechensis AK7 TaxID=1237149 RepID=L8JS41_9BACT|nr:LuxR C-terminal-related transcriptional regulator [Fulvivirga imtechensis]ELR71680.1 LuxR family transcriptional regulator protein [Fulvivirga imtechensis AK7]